jgi:hypothetical protein
MWSVSVLLTSIRINLPTAKLGFLKFQIRILVREPWVFVDVGKEGKCFINDSRSMSDKHEGLVRMDTCTGLPTSASSRNPHTGKSKQYYTRSHFLGLVL